MVLLTAPVDAQVHTISNLRKKTVPTSGVVRLDSVSIVPQTFIIAGYDSAAYQLDWVNAILYWNKSNLKDSVEVIYRIFPFKFNQVVQHYSFDSTNKEIIAKSLPDNTTNKTSLFDFGNLNYNGSFGRSLNFGNNQNAVFNSQLNLQLNGFIADSIEVTAAITDNNLPIQPDGTTQQLNEFDRVLLQFKKKSWELNLGDIDLRQNEQYFLRFYKRLQGMSFLQAYGNNKTANKTLVSGAIAKGKFARNIFQGQEGNQGPYRLQGNNNELFFIVLAGTERVYLDGEFLQRGEEQDYVINYNTAEVRFTPRRMITKDKRIQVEFEYADRNYLNSMLYLNHNSNINKKLTVQFSAYSNTDAKSSPINQTLDTQQEQFLSNLGDSINNAFYTVANIDSFSVTKILYKKTDTIYNGNQDSIFVYSTSPDSARYSLSFIEVGLNKGNYIPLFSGANGKVYQWVQPLNGIPQGSFEPAVFLVTPKKQQVFSLTTNYLIDSKTSVQADIAVSNHDVNTFSNKHSGDNQGIAGKLILNRTQQLFLKSKPLQFQSYVGYEWVQQNFRPIERLRGVEFGRDWGLFFLLPPATEHLPSAGFKIADGKGNNLQYDFTSYIRSDRYKGYRNIFRYEQQWKGWRVNSIFNLTNFKSQDDKGYFLRPFTELTKIFKQLNNISVGTSYSLEHNEVRNILLDSVTPYSFAFETIAAFMKSDAAKLNKWAFTYFTRKDKQPYQTSLVQTDRSHNYNFQSDWLQNNKHQFKVNFTYRQLVVNTIPVSISQPDNSLLSRAEYYINEWKGLVNGSVWYELGAGQEQKRDLSYFEVPAGRGEYAWIDYNADGIQQLNEFEIAQFQDQAKFIRIFTPTNQFTKANYTQFNYNITINPRNLLAGESSKAIWSRFLLQSSLQTGKKELAKGNLVFDPFKTSIADTALINLNHVFSNTISFNRFSSKWGIDFTNVRNFNKSLLTYGLETRQFTDWVLKSRINFLTLYTLELVNRYNRNALSTPAFDNRNYTITSYQTEPRISYTYLTKLRIQMSYQFIQRKNAVNFGGEQAKNHSINVETKYSILQNSNINGRVTYTTIDYSGSNTSPVSYIMLEGLLPGKNMLWSIDFTKRLMNNLEFNVQYEGRKAGNSRTIHIGRAAVRAIL